MSLVARKKESFYHNYRPRYFRMFQKLGWGTIYIHGLKCLQSIVLLRLEMSAPKGFMSGLRRILCYLQYLACVQSLAGAPLHIK